MVAVSLKKWTAELNRGVVLSAIEAFGVERTMFGSNFPVDGLCVGFGGLIDGMREILRDLPQQEQRAFFHDNAVRLYAMEPA